MFAKNPNHRSRRHPVRAGVFVLVLLCAAAAAGGVVMALWNAVLVQAAGVKPLGFWQALGLLLLCRLLFGNWGPRRRPFAPPSGEPSLRLSPEQRAQFRASWKSCAAERAAQTPPSNHG